MRAIEGHFARTAAVLSRPVPALDGVRGIAILLVLFHHFGYKYTVHNRVQLLLHRSFELGWCGVDLFFVLSGFLITGILLDTRRAANYFQSFYARRVLRIFPAFFLFLGGTSLIVRLPHAAMYWTYLANWIPYSQQYPPLYHLWSLSIEEQFYFVWPLLVFWLAPRQLGRAAILIAAAAVVIRSDVHGWLRYEATPARLDGFAISALAAVALRDEEWHAWAVRLWRPALALGAAGFFWALWRAHEATPHSAAMGGIGLSCIAIAGTGLLVGTVTEGFLARPLEARWLRTYGKYSYAIYLFHFPLSVWLEQTGAVQGFVADHGLLYVIAAAGGSLLLGIASWRLFEARFNAYKSRFAARHDTDAAVAPA
ncbi:MAG TPA: acyltransferase [Myxococcales bacterium]